MMSSFTLLTGLIFHCVLNGFFGGVTTVTARTIKNEVTTNVKFYINNCVGELSLDNYHNYTGVTIIAPPDSVALHTSGMFEYEYAARPLFGSYLDGNVNWYQTGTTSILVHYYFSVNQTGGIYLDIEDHHVLSAVGCADVPNNGGTLPTIVGVYAFWTANTSLDACKTATNTIDSCTYEFDAL